ncbi:hypothetical protein WJX72_007671 [[Myrmecia] bisecta]|uniref:Chromatin-remodeling ATPase INO80 n=1 Tax=[Myrmecia] bisecta TaxID=41462 RepID=A0AAW1R7X8_9CHLO
MLRGSKAKGVTAAPADEAAAAAAAAEVAATETQLVIQPSGLLPRTFDITKPFENGDDVVELGGRQFCIPPFYDVLAAQGRFPTLQELEIEAGLLGKPMTIDALTQIKNASKPDPDVQFHALGVIVGTAGKRTGSGPLGEGGRRRRSGSGSRTLYGPDGQRIIQRRRKRRKREEIPPEQRRKRTGAAAGIPEPPYIPSGSDAPVRVIVCWEASEERAAQPRALAQEELLRLPEDEQRSHAQAQLHWRWAKIACCDAPRAAHVLPAIRRKHLAAARYLAEACAREYALRLQRAQKDAAKASQRMRKLVRDMMTHWRRAEREAAEAKKQGEKEAVEAAKRAEEERERQRQEQRLAFLLTQTELYSHFMANKLGTPAGADAAAADHAAAGTAAAVAAEVAVQKTTAKMASFDAEYATLAQKGADGHAPGTLEGSLVNPTTMPASSTVEQPAGLKATLKGYQLKGLQWLVGLYEQGLNGILADEMGLGKTVQAIAFMAHLAECKGIWGPFLVVAPASTLHNWDQELQQFCPSLRVLPYWGQTADRKLLRKHLAPRRLYGQQAAFHVCVTSYQMAVQDESYLRRVRWQYMVLDEAQAIKSSVSLRWKTLLGFNCRNRLLLSGTPIQNNMAELWALLHFIMPSLFDNEDQFHEWFSKGIEGHAEGVQELNEHQLKRLHAILSPFMLRRVKQDVASEMAPKVEHTVYCQPSLRQQVVYAALKAQLDLSDLFDNGKLSERRMGSLMNLVMQLRKVCNHPQLFEEQTERAPLHFAALPPPPQPTAFGEPDWLPYLGGRSDIGFHLPRLIYEEGLPCLPSTHTGGLDTFASKWLRHRFNIFSPANLHAGAVGESGPLVLPLARRLLKAGDMLRAVTGFVPPVLAPPPHLTCSHRGFAHQQSDLQRSPWLLRLLFGPLPSLEAPGLSPCTAMGEATGSFLAGAPPLLRELSGRRLAAKRPLLGPICRVFGTAPARREYSLAKALVDSGKMAVLDALLRRLKAEGHKVLLFSQMTAMMGLLADYLAYRRYRFLRLDGSTVIADRRDMVRAFQTQPDIFVFLLSTRAGGLGINLTAADTVIFYDSDWNPTMDMQAMDRAHRLGQTREVTVYRLVIRGSVEERILARAQQKATVQQLVMSSNADASAPDVFAPSDMLSLLSDEGTPEQLAAAKEAKLQQSAATARMVGTSAGKAKGTGTARTARPRASRPRAPSGAVRKPRNHTGSKSASRPASNPASRASATKANAV